MIHRALLGSIERFMGDFNRTLCRRIPNMACTVQAAVIPVSQNHFDYAKQVADELKKNDIYSRTRRTNEKIGYKIRDWKLRKSRIC